MLGRTGVAHYGRRCSWAHSEGHIGVAHYGRRCSWAHSEGHIGVAHYGRRCLWAHLGEVPTMPPFFLDRGGERSGKNCSVINVNG